MDNHRSIWRIIDLSLVTASALLMVHALRLALVIAPDERIMGAIQRIFYFHVGSAIACYIAFGIVFMASIFYLATKQSHFDNLSAASGEVGFLFCTIVLLSGMIWGHAAWNVWFRFEPRLVTFLLLWFIFLAFILLRAFGEPGKIAAHSAVLGIVGAISVPLMIYSIKLLPATAQLHPQVIENRGLKEPLFRVALAYSTMALSVTCVLLIRIRYRIEVLQEKLRERRLS